MYNFFNVNVIIHAVEGIINCSSYFSMSKLDCMYPATPSTHDMASFVYYLARLKEIKRNTTTRSS